MAGIIPLGTSMDYESERTRALGCWNGPDLVGNLVKETTSKMPTESFEPSNEYCDFIVNSGFGKDCPADKRKLWHELVKKNYAGDAGRRRMREAAVNLQQRDGLHARLTNVTRPVLWLHGDADVVYSVANAKEEIKLFDNSSDTKLLVVPGGHHFLSSTHPNEVDSAVFEFVTKHSQGMKTDARALIESCWYGGDVDFILATTVHRNILQSIHSFEVDLTNQEIHDLCAVIGSIYPV